MYEKLKHEKRKPSAHDFVAIWDKADALLIEKAIEEGCEQVDIFDWGKEIELPDTPGEVNEN